MAILQSTTVTGSLIVSGSTDNLVQVIGSGSTLFSVNGASGQLFGIADDLTDSLFSVNTIAGLPVIEAFADNTVKIGTFGSEELIVSESQVTITSGSLLGPLYLEGNVGIGTTSPSSTLHVNGPDTNDHTPTVFLKNNGANGGEGEVLDVFTARGDGANDSYIARFRNSASTKFYIRGDGLIGIGTESPSAKLHISGSSEAVFKIQSNRNDIRLLEEDTTDTNSLIRHQTGLLRFDTISDDELTITTRVALDHSTGYFGIGTTSPSNLLDLESSSTSGTQLHIVNTSTGGSDWRLVSAGSANSINAGYFGLYNSTWRMVIDDSGNVGIGTTNPDYQLHIHEATSGQAYVKFTNSTTGEGGSDGALIGLASSEDLLIANYESTNTRFTTNAVERMRIDSSGNVGIGTTDPKEKLHIQGNITGSGNLTLEGNAGYPIFESGFGGSGWRIDSSANAEFQNLTVRGTFSVYELLAQQIRATNGSLLVATSGKVDGISGTTLFFDSGSRYGHGFEAGDVLLAQRLDPEGGQLKRTFITVDSTSNSGSLVYTDLSGDTPEVGQEFVRIGNTGSLDRQGHIYLTADDSNAPYIGVRDGLSGSVQFTSGTGSIEKVRVGRLDGITSDTFGSLNGYGLHTQNIYAEGNTQIAGTLTAGDGNGVGTTFYAGRINKNLIYNPSLSYTDGTTTDPYIGVSNYGSGTYAVGHEATTGISGFSESVAYVTRGGTGTGDVRLFYDGNSYEYSGTSLTLTFSIYAKVRDGGGSALINTRISRTLDTDITEKNTTIPDDGSWHRIHITGTWTTAPTNGRLYLRIPINRGIYFSGVQLEEGAEVTAYQETDHVSLASTGYGMWARQGGFGGSTQNPVVELGDYGFAIKNADSIYASALTNNSIQIGNISGSANSAIKLTNTGTNSTSGLFGYTSTGDESFALKLDGTAEIAGFSISGNSLHLDEGAVEVGLGTADQLSWSSAVVGLQAGEDADNRIFLGEVQGLYEFRVLNGGDSPVILGSRDNRISSWSLQTTEIQGGTVSGGGDGSYTTSGIRLGADGYISAPKFFLDSGGNANFKGTLTAPDGNIGGFTLSNDAISGTNFYLSGSATGNEFFISSSNFNVKANGDVTGSSVLFDGGKIGGFDITSDKLSITSGDFEILQGSLFSNNIGYRVVETTGGNRQVNMRYDTADDSLEFLVYNDPNNYFNVGDAYANQYTGWGLNLRVDGEDVLKVENETVTLSGFTATKDAFAGDNFYISGSATGNEFFISASNFNVKANGDLTASNANIEGRIVAETGELRDLDVTGTLTMTNTSDGTITNTDGNYIISSSGIFLNAPEGSTASDSSKLLFKGTTGAYPFGSGFTTIGELFYDGGFGRLTLQTISGDKNILIDSDGTLTLQADYTVELNGSRIDVNDTLQVKDSLNLYGTAGSGATADVTFINPVDGTDEDEGGGVTGGQTGGDLTIAGGRGGDINFGNNDAADGGNLILKAGAGGVNTVGSGNPGTSGSIQMYGEVTINSSGSTVFDIQGSQGQLFSVTDDLTGTLFSVNDISGIPILSVDSDDTVTMGTFGANTLVVTGSNVGIGTTSPSVKLEVDTDTISAEAFRINNSVEKTVEFGHLNFGAPYLTLTTGSASKIQLRTDGGDNFITPGNVGIGTTSPGNTLHVYKNATIGTITSTTTANAGLRIQDSGANMYMDGNSIVLDNTGYLTTNGAYDFVIGTNNTARIHVDSGGDVGIGTDSPGAHLHIQGAGDEMLRLADTSTTGQPYISFYQTSTRRSFIQHVDGDDLLSLASEYGGIRFMTGTGGTEVERVRIDSSGGVGIGTTNTSTNLGDDTEPRFVLDGRGYMIDTNSGTNRYRLWGMMEPRPIRPSSITRAEAGNIGTNVDTTRFPNVYGESDLSAIDNDATFTYANAVAAAETHGGRLPTLQEVMAGVGQGSGQGYDTEYIWTQTTAGHNRVWVCRGRFDSYPEAKIVDITDAGEVYRVRAAFDVSKANMSVHYDDNSAIRTNVLKAQGSTSNLELYNGGGVGIVVTGSNGDVGIGTTTPSSKLDVAGDITTSGNLIVASGQGIDFSATSDAGGMTSELLDDYEEGTWTPQWISAGFSSITMDVVNANYTKIGNTVFLTAYVRTDFVDVSSAAADTEMSGLPFTPVAGDYFAISVPWSDNWGDEPTGGYIENDGSSSRLYFHYRDASDGPTISLKAGDFIDGTNQNRIMFSAIYITS